MTDSAVIRMKEFKSYPDVLLVVCDGGAASWLAESFATLATCDGGLENSTAIGNGSPIASPDGIVVRFQVIRDGVDRGLVEREPNHFFWEISHENAARFSNMVAGISNATVVTGEGGTKGTLQPMGAHQYLIPSNSPPAPAIMVSIGEYNVKRLLELRGVVK